MLRSVAVPVRVVTEPALTVPDVLPSRVLRRETARVVSESVMFSSSSPVMPSES